tara:strand:- start:546 stop:1037 length:492 start_codon:yes stop_codon:yes gene_type:complete
MILPGKEATSLYVAEHCLQTIAWIGQPFGLWLQTLESEKRAQTLRDFLGNPLTLTRGLEAIGAIGLPEGENMLLPWLIRENREEQTAAADALLRCSPLPLQEKTKTVIQKIMGNQALSDEALFSLSLLLDANSAPPIELDSAEVERRRRWFKRRWRTPTLKSD